MSNDLSVLGSELPANRYASEDVFGAITSAAFLPRLQLMSSNSDIVKEGKLGIGRWALLRSNDNFIDLSPEVNVFVLAWRAKALEIGDQVMSFYDPKSEDFKKVMVKSEQPNSGCLYGPEFLVYIPSENAFASLFMASKTARREAPNVKAILETKEKKATLKVRLIKNTQYSWHGPVATICSQQLPLPDLDAARDQITRFNNPPQTEAEEVAPETADRER